MCPTLRWFVAILHAIEALDHRYQAWTNLSAREAVAQVVVILSVNLILVVCGRVWCLGGARLQLSRVM